MVRDAPSDHLHHHGLMFAVQVNEVNFWEERGTPGPDEVRNLPAHAELLFLAGQRPIVAGKLAYYADSEFRGLYDAP